MMSTTENYEKSDTRKPEEFDALGEDLNEIYISILERAQKAHNKFQFKRVRNENENDQIRSFDNLLCYLVLREQNLSDLQIRLAEVGLASLAMSESNVLFSIEQVLKHFGIRPVNTSSLLKIDPQSGRLLMSLRSKLMFGLMPKERRTHIMVTLDSSDIYQYELIDGMDIARINCAHNTAREWKLLVETLRGVEEQLVQNGKGVEGRICMILMDLGGPKIRTGPMELKVRPLQIPSPKDIHGRPMRLVEGFLDSEARATEVLNLEGAPPSSFVIAISKINYGGLGGLRIGQKITFKDARDGRPRNLTVLERISPTRVRIGLEHRAFLKEGIKLECQINDSDNDRKCSFTVGVTKPQPIEISVEAGNILRLYRDTRLGHGGDSNRFSDDPTGISCTYPSILDQVKVGYKVLIDDGKIEAIVKSSKEEYLELEIVSPHGIVAKIKSNKGINFPDSGIKTPALTQEDIKNLDFIVKHADMVGLSFVHGPQDIYDLHKELTKRNCADLGIVAKIETSDSVHNLARTLIAGLDLPRFAVLIARGDLAVEVGFENLAFIQEDILCLCEAAHVPVILATQILESLTESGLRSRPEIADALIMGRRVECVMLSNGPNILEAIRTLARLLSSGERYLIKYQLFREFTEQYDVFDDEDKD
ncbi:MAG: pyruvate kinase [Nitrososphaeraceae archaeon]